MRKIIAIASGDWHLHKFKAFDINGSRLKTSLKYGKKILDRAAELEVPHLFVGDLFHTPKEVENETVTSTIKMFSQSKAITYAISGNHDMSEKNSDDNKSPSYLKALNNLKNFHLLDWCGAFIDDGKTLMKSYESHSGFNVTGIPYYNSISKLIEMIERRHITEGPNILLLHCDFPGAKTPLGIEVKEASEFEGKIKKLFKRFDLVLIGHIHKPQKLHRQIYMLGSPWQQNQGDMGTDMGYWEVYSDFSMRFVKLNAPKFIQLQKGENAKDEKNYYLPYEEPEAEEELKDGNFAANSSRKSLAKRYCKVKGIKSKYKRNLLIEILNEAE